MKSAVIFTVFLGALWSSHTALASHALMAECLIKPTTGDPDVPVYGSIVLYQEEVDNPVYIAAALGGFNTSEPNRYHGFHIHRRGRLGEKCVKARGHLVKGIDTKAKYTHGAPTDHIRHAGDLGNIEENGSGQVSFTSVDTRFNLNAVIGKAIVVHATEDDLGRGGDAGSEATGNAGKRLGCCRIKLIH